jgi:hypothetical protein
VPLFVVCLGAVAAIVGLGYSNLSHDVNATNDRLSAVAEARLSPAGGMRSQPQVTLVVGSSDLRSAAAGAAQRIVLVRTDPASGTISLLRVPTKVNVPLPGGGLKDSVTASIAGPPSELVATIDRLVGLRVNHLVLADRAGFDDLVAGLGGSGTRGTLATQLRAWSGILHLSSAGSALRASFASDLSAGSWISLGRLRIGADQAVRCRLGSTAQTLPGGAIGIAGGRNRQALDAFLGRGGAASSGACGTRTLSAAVLGSGIGAAEALLIAAAVLLGLILLTLLRPLAAAGMGRLEARRGSSRPGPPVAATPPSQRPRPAQPRRGGSGSPAAAAPPVLAPVASYTRVASAPAPERAADGGDEPAAAQPSPGPKADAAANGTADAPANGTAAAPANGRAEVSPAGGGDAPAAVSAPRAARRTASPQTTRWVRQCANCGRRELSRQWETREQAERRGRLPLRRGQWQCERCGSSDFQVVEYRGPRWMQWE